MTASPSLFLGASRPLDGGGEARALHLPVHHLVTHGVVVGMTGSGKTGLLTVLVEETLNAGVPVLMIDVKGDLPNLLLAFPTFSAGALEPWVEPAPGDARSVRAIAEALAEERRTGLSAWGIDEPSLERFHQRVAVRVITPGSSAGESLHVLSSLERPVTDWKNDAE